MTRHIKRCHQVGKTNNVVEHNQNIQSKLHCCHIFKCVSFFTCVVKEECAGMVDQGLEHETANTTYTGMGVDKLTRTIGH